MMKGSDLLRIVDQMHHEKNIDQDIIFEGIEAALQLATQKKYGEESDVTVDHRPRLRRNPSPARARRSSTPPNWAASPPRAPSKS